MLAEQQAVECPFWDLGFSKPSVVELLINVAQQQEYYTYTGWPIIIINSKANKYQQNYKQAILP